MITKIKIKKFRKLENVNENNIGLVNELYGSNGCGKSSFINFISWMIYGETLDYDTNDDMNIDVNKNEEFIGGLIECDNEYTFERNYGYEDNKKVNEFFINGRKCKNQQEYYSFIKNIFNLKIDFKINGLNIIRALSDPYLLTSNENQFRNIIEKLLNINSDDILFSREDEKYLPIKKDYEMQQRSYENLISFYNQKIKETEILISSTKENIEKLSNINFDEGEYNQVVEDIKNLKESYKLLDNNDIENEKKELNSLYEKLLSSKENDLNNCEKKDALKEIQDIKKRYMDKNEEYNLAYRTNIDNERLRKEKIKELDDKNKELNDLKNKKSVEKRCPKCNAIINDEELKDFETNKEKSIKKIENEIVLLERELCNIKDFDCEALNNELKSIYEELQNSLDNYNKLKNDFVSENTLKLNKEYNNLKLKIIKDTEEYNSYKENYNNDFNNKLKMLEEKYNILNENYIHHKNLKTYKNNKKVLLENLSIYELRKSLLKEFQIDTIKLIKNETNKIFGEDIDFEMLKQNKTNDSYKKVCQAKINDIDIKQNNTANNLKYNIYILEKIKDFIGGCNIPIIFDISDNIGKSVRNDIFKNVKSSQIFYTRIDDNDNVERELRVIKNED